MTMDLDDVFSGIAPGFAHDCEQDFIQCARGFRIANFAVVKAMGLELATFSLRAMKNSCRNIFCIHTADANNCDATFTRRRRNRGDRVFLVHRSGVILTAPRPKAMIASRKTAAASMTWFRPNAGYDYTTNNW